MKEGSVKALKLCFTRDEAERFIETKPRDKLTIVERKGESIKCLEYCSVCEHCSFYKAMKAENAKGEE
jgi:hypothetical protein